MYSGGPFPSYGLFITGSISFSVALYRLRYVYISIHVAAGPFSATALGLGFGLPPVAARLVLLFFCPRVCILRHGSLGFLDLAIPRIFLTYHESSSF